MKRTIRTIELEKGYMPKAPDVAFEFLIKCYRQNKRKGSTAVSGSHVNKIQRYDEMLKYGTSKDATEAFKRKPYEAIDVATYLEGKGVDTGGQVNTDRVCRHERRDKGYQEKD